MERNSQKNGLIDLLALLGVGVAGFIVARYTHSLSGQVGLVFIGLGILVATVSWFQMRLEDAERLERLELDELAKGRTSAALFEAKDAEMLPARRSREQFERYFVPAFTVLLCLAKGTAAFLLWRWLSKVTTAVDIKQPTMALAMFGLFALILFLVGKFSSSIARLEHQRLLRPGASYVLLGAYVCFIITAAIIGVESGFPKTDRIVAFVFCGVLGLVAVETLIQLVLEIYRPRVKGKVVRPLYESRLVGLLGQPEGLITTAAQALDYQFGFKVSETWFYRFFEKALGWLILLQLGALLLSTCVVFIDAGEQGVREHFGRTIEGRALLGPGAHLKWPWPIDRVDRFRTDQVQTLHVGYSPEEEKHEEKAVLWTVSHAKEENFLVANKAEAAAPRKDDAAETKRTPPVSLVTVSIPVQFQIHDLLAWAYNNDNAPALLQDLATREVVRYLVGVDLNDIMSHGRLEAAETLVQRIQAAADERKLGARIISVGLQDLHPPVKVAPDYEKVVGATQTRQAKILAAQADQIRTNALAEAQGIAIVNRAMAERTSREIGALAQAALFTNQIPAFRAAPAVYAQRAFLQTFARSTANARKYIILTTNTHDVLTFDLQDKIREDLLNTINVPAPKK